MTSPEFELNMHSVLCAGCGKILGISESKTPLRNKVYHGPRCILQTPPRVNRQRDLAIAESRQQGTSVAALAKEFGLSRQRVHSIVKSVKGTD